MQHTAGEVDDLEAHQRRQLPVGSARRLEADEISLGQLVADFKRSWFWIVLAGLVCAGVGGLSAYLRADEYEAAVVIAPITESGLKPGGLNVGSLLGLADFAMPSVTGSTSVSRAEAMAILQSDELTASYIEQNSLLRTLFAEDWNDAAKRWRFDAAEGQPTVWKGVQLFKKTIRTVTDEKRTGIVTLKIRWTDPVLCARWANDLVALANDHLRARAIEEAKRNVLFLNEEAAKTDVIDLRRAIYSLIEQELSKQMIANGRKEYALKILDPATVPEKSISFGTITLSVAGAVAGLFLGVFALLFRRIVLDAAGPAGGPPPGAGEKA